MRLIGKGYNNAKAALRGESFSNKNSFSAGITYQLASKKAYSVSHGFGVYIGYRYAFSDKIITKGSSPFAVQGFYSLSKTSKEKRAETVY